MVMMPRINAVVTDHEAISAKFKVITTSNHAVPDCFIKNKEELQSTLDRGLNVLSEAQQRLYWDKICYWSVTTALILGIITISIFSDFPQNYACFYQIMLVIFTCLIIFCSFMATVWNQIELNGLLSTHKTMQALLNHVITYQSEPTNDYIIKSDDTFQNEEENQVHKRSKYTQGQEHVKMMLQEI
uniref:Uncharacterized protein n=1 Tax=Clastoptera arizonana TaxID=38151 RepID=A0A1B6CEW0_9HEMI